MVEKPFGCNLAEAQTVVDRARAVGRPVMVAENFRFFQAERTLRHMLDEGVVGRMCRRSVRRSPRSAQSYPGAPG